MGAENIARANRHCTLSHPWCDAQQQKEVAQMSKFRKACKVMVLATCLGALLSPAAAFGKKKKKKAVSAKVEVECSFTYKVTGLAKYDNFLSTSKSLIYRLDRADYAIRNVVPKFKLAAKTIMGLIGDTQDLSDDAEEFAQIFPQLAESMKKNARLVIYIRIDDSGMRISVRPETKAEYDKPDLITQIEKSLSDVNVAIKTLKAIPENLAGSVKESKSLAAQGNKLIGSAKGDFKGLKARKLPGCVSSMKEAVKLLATVPEKVKNLTGASEKLIQDLKSLGK